MTWQVVLAGLLGTVFGVVLMAMMQIASDADDEADAVEELLRGYEDDKHRRAS